MNYNSKSTKRVKSLKIKISPHYRKRTFLLTILKIIYFLFYAESPEIRHNFIHDHPFLNKLYEQVLQDIGKELNLPVKRCVRCGICFLPDYRTCKQQKNCPYGCVKLNRAQNIKRAKKRYREKKEARIKGSEYNRSYRSRQKNGEEAFNNDNLAADRVPEKLRNQIIYIYGKLNPGISGRKLKQLERVLKILEKRCKNERDTILISMEKGYINDNRAREGPC